MRIRKRHWHIATCLWFRKTRLLFYFIVLSLITIKWFVSFHRTKLTNESQSSLSKHRAIISKVRRLHYPVKMLSFKFTIRDHVKAVTIHKGITKQLPTPRDANHKEDGFKKWPIVISVGCSYRNLVYLLESLRVALVESKITVICIFAFKTCEGSAQEVMRIIVDEFEVCFNKVVWNIYESSSHVNFGKRHPRIEQNQKLKLQWWNFIDTIFRDGIQEGVLFNEILKDFNQDILFVDSNVLLSPDFLQVATYASQIKSSLPGIVQLSLGIWGGHNLVNAHPDTFAIRQSRDLHVLAFGMNQSNWRTLSELQQDFLEGNLDPDWALSVGEALSKSSGGFGIQTIVPTLSRYWFTTSNNVPNLENSIDHIIDPEKPLARPSFPPWLLSPRLINESIVNEGVRDSLGFLCNKAHTLNDGSAKNAICYCSFWRWKNTERASFPGCFPQGTDSCLHSY